MTPRPPSAAPVARDLVSAAEPGKRWYAEHGLRIYRYLRYHVRSADEAEELTAETFLRAVRGAESYDASRGSAKAWLFRIAQNVLRDARRRERRREWLPLGALRDVAWEAPSPEERLLREEEVAALLRAVAGLGDRDRELVSLRYGSELEYGEIAELLGIGEGAVRTRLWRALSRLRARLGE